MRAAFALQGPGGFFLRGTCSFGVIPFTPGTLPAVKQGMPDVRVVDSITQPGSQDQRCIAMSGSLGGSSAARYALNARPLICFFSDAGVGKDVADLALLQSAGLAACAVSHTSACIGEAQSTLHRGEISQLNLAAQALGLHVGKNYRYAVTQIQSS
jgi:hypothetical protein